MDLRRPCVTVVIGAAVGLAGCQGIAGIRELEYSAAADACDASAVPPDPPTLSDAGDAFTFAVALGGADFGDGDDPPTNASIGYDLDGVCTTAEAGATCQPLTWAGGRAVDGLEGRDNGVGWMIVSQAEYLGLPALSSASVSDRIRAGKSPPIALLRIVGYSGLPDDDAVRVEVYASAGPYTEESPPAWDGTDAWAVSAADVVGQTDDLEWPHAARSASRAGYVQGFTLVAQFDDPVDVRFFDAPVPVRALQVTANLVQDQATLRWGLQDALVTGTVETQALLGLIPDLLETFVGVRGFCSDNPQYQDLKALFCAFADTPVAADDAPSEPCAFTSFGFRGEAIGVRLAGVADVAESAPICPPETDPAADDCASP